MSYFVTDERPAQRGRLRSQIGDSAWMVDIFGTVDTAGDHAKSTTIVPLDSMRFWRFFEHFQDMQQWLLKHPTGKPTLSSVMPEILATANERNEA